MAFQKILKLPFNPNFLESTTDEQLLEKELDYLKNISPVSIPASLVNQVANRELFMDKSGKKVCIKFNKGTTCLSFRYKNGICIASDARATGGEFIASSTVFKIIKINQYMFGTMAGGAADCQYWLRVLTIRCRMHELRNRERITTSAASKLLCNMVSNYKGMGLSLGCMICGWNKDESSIYYVDHTGLRVPGDLFSVGSGSTYAYGILDSEYKYDMEDEEAYDLARRAIYHAAFRDIASGGMVRILHLTKDGYKWISQQDLKDVHFMFQEQKMQN